MPKKRACPVGSRRTDGRCRSIKKMCYHDRCGHFILHQTPDGKRYVMVRKTGGGTKRLYLDRNGNIPVHLRTKK